MAVAMLAPGGRMTSDAANAPIANRGASGDVRQYQLNLDGQQVTSEMGFGNQPRFSQESIGEFQYISNRFDATLGRSSAVQVIAVTKSGANSFAGSLRGNFRDSSLNAPDPVLHRVVPIDNRQLAFTLGGPILKNRLHFFVHDDYEGEPKTSIWNTPYPAFNVELRGSETVKMGGGRVDYEFSPSVRLMGKVTDAEHWQPFTAGDTSHPAATGSTRETNREYLVKLTHVLNNRAVNEISAGKTRWIFTNANLTSWSKHWQAPNGVTTGSPRITFSAFSIGGNTFYPRHGAQDTGVCATIRAVVRSARTSRHEGRRRSRLHGRRWEQLPVVHGRDRCPGRDADAGTTPSVVPRSLERRYLEPRGNLASRADL